MANLGFSRRNQGLFTALGSCLFIAFLCLVFEPRWETNDDVGMSMVAHGYGCATYGSSTLLYSNVLWGYLVRNLPTIHGVLGYSSGTLLILIVSAWAISYFLLRLGISNLIAFLAVILLLARPTLFPQFTVNAGLLGIAALIGWLVHSKEGDRRSLLIACILAFLSFLIRDDQYFLVMTVGIPLFPWRSAARSPVFRNALLILFLAIISATMIDNSFYKTSEWQNYLALDPARWPFTDFGAAEHLKHRPDITSRYGYSKNDLDLVRHWFFVDPRIANPASLKAMLTELGPIAAQPGNINLGWLALKQIATPILLPFLFVSLVFLLISPKWPLAIGWMLWLVILFAIGISGRPGILRIYIPIMSLLLLLPLCMGYITGPFREHLAIIALAVACCVNFYLLVTEQASSKKVVADVKTDIKEFPHDVFVAWGESFPYEFVYPVLTNIDAIPHLRIYSLGTDTLAPYSVSVAEEKAGRGLIARLKSDEGVPVITSPERLGMLDIYCAEHMGKQLSVVATYTGKSISLNTVRCE